MFNDASGIAACLDALLLQDYPRELLEIVVVDNGSIPPLTINGCAGTIARIVRCETPGAYAARNAGAKIATGDIFAFTDADCVPDPKWILEGVQALTDAAPTGIVGGDVTILAPSRRNGTSLYQYETGFQQRENIERKGFSATANLLCWRTQFDVVGPFEQSLYSGADREWGWRASKSGFSLTYCERARVATLPRVKLPDAIRQARRIAAGRRQLAARGLTWRGGSALEPHRTGISALKWILGRERLTWWERQRVLAAAVAIRLATAFEHIRLVLGGHAERR